MTDIVELLRQGPYGPLVRETIEMTEDKEYEWWCDITDEAADRIGALEQANTALMTERTSLIATKREQLAALTAERDMWRAQALRGGS